MKHAAATLGSGNLRLAVLLPEGEDLNEWVAVNSKYQCVFLTLTKYLFIEKLCIPKINIVSGFTINI